MARLARVVVPGIPHHVTQRGNRRQKTFFADDDCPADLQRQVKSCQMTTPSAPKRAVAVAMRLTMKPVPRLSAATA